MSVRNRLLFLVIIVCMALYGFLRWQAVTRPREGGPLLRFFHPDRITEISLRNSSASVQMEQKNGRYVFIRPYAGRQAADVQVTKFLKALAGLAIRRDVWSDRIADEKNIYIPAFTAFGIRADSPRLRIAQGRRSYELVLGTSSPVAPLCYVFDGDSRHVMLTDIVLRDLLTAPPEFFRDRDIIGAPPSEIRSLKVARAGAVRFTLTREGSDWYLLNAADNNEYLCDALPAQELAGSIAGLVVVDFAPLDDGLATARCGLDRPAWSVTVGLSTGPARRIDFGVSWPKGAVCAGRDGAVVGAVPSGIIARLAAQTSSYFRTMLADAPPGLIASFTCAAAGDTVTFEKYRGSWSRTARIKRDFPREAVERFLSAVYSLRVEGVLRGWKPGLPERTYSFRDKNDRELFGLALYKTRDGDFAASLTGKRGLFAVNGMIAEELNL